MCESSAYMVTPEGETKIMDYVVDIVPNDDGSLTLSDLLGGTPFRTAMIEAQAFEDVEVIAGVNLPILLESMVLRYGSESLIDFIASALEAGKTGLVHAQLPQESETQTFDEEEGI